VGTAVPWESPVPAVTCTSQATLLTGKPPSEHGVVGNGWYFRDTQEIRFWQQANSLIQSDKFYDGIDTAKMFWWFNQSSGCRYSVTPKPHYGCDGSKVFDVLDRSGCDLVSRLGAFPFFSFWGPNAGLPSSEWIADATAVVMREKKPSLTLAYLPHLDYDYQRKPIQDPARVAEVDQCVEKIIAAANDIDAQVVVVSEYGLTPVERPVHINRVLRSAGPGIAAVVDPAELQLDHDRSGDLIALAETDSWFTYYYWMDDVNAPDFAKCVDIHRKPGYDPCELFMDSKLNAAFALAKKKLGFRYRMNVIPLDASLVKGSHGLRQQGDAGPLVIGPGSPPDRMVDFRGYVEGLLQKS